MEKTGPTSGHQVEQSSGYPEGGGSFSTKEIAKLLKIKVRSCYRFLAWASSLIPLVEERRGSTNYYWVEKPIKKQGEKI